MQISSAWTSGSRRRAGRRSQGATTQERTPIGIAAAAQTPRICASEYCLTAAYAVRLAGPLASSPVRPEL